MKRSEEIWHAQPTRQAPIAIVLIVFSIVKSLIRTWWPMLLIVVFRSDFLGPDNGKLLASAVVAIVIIFSILEYFKFHFFIGDGKLHVQKGVFRKVKKDIPFDRIQTISFEQNVVHQLFDVVRLKVDTAGSSKEEFEFAALGRQKAEDIRTFILNRKTSINAGDLESTQKTSASLIFSLSVMDLVKVGVSQNHLRTMGIILVFLLGLRDRIKDSLGDTYTAQFDEVAEDLYDSSFAFSIVMFFGLLIVAFLGTLVYTIFRYYNLGMWKTGDGYKVEGGLLNRREQAALDEKIQILRWVKNPLRDLFEIVFLRLYQASSGGRKSSSIISIPGCHLSKLEEVRATYFGQDYYASETAHGVDRRFFYRRLLFIGMVPIIGYLALGWLTQEGFLSLIGSMMWLIVVGGYQFFYQRNWRYYLKADILRTKSGVIERVHKAIYLHKIQSVQIRQTPYQRRLSLANVVVHTASGDIRIPYIPLGKAKALKRYILYKIESSSLGWM